MTRPTNLANLLKTLLLVFSTVLFSIDCPFSLASSDSGSPLTFKCDQGSTATLDIFLPKKRSGDGAVIICPGGGYLLLGKMEGVPIANWLTSNGVTAFLLKYTLPKEGDHLMTLSDAANAVSFVRSHASQWQINPAKIALMGFSAGGHLSSTIATHYKSVCKPNYQILIYPVITMKDPYVHTACRKYFLGEHPSSADIALFSNEEHVDKTTPPTFIFHASTDKEVHVENSDQYVASLRKAKVPVDYIRVSLPDKHHGGHGMGLDSSWTAPLLRWFNKYHF